MIRAPVAALDATFPPVYLVLSGELPRYTFHLDGLWIQFEKA